AATSIPPLLLDRVSPFIFELAGANHTDWDSRHSLYHVIRKQTMAPYTWKNFFFLGMAQKRYPPNEGVL
ncbi:MAG: hypothetical protein VB083_05565, partial [Aminobacterium sp.]|nr:hypothetical protein [Aminobacterium sp.]